MTEKADFTQEEWQLVLKGPPCAGMIVLTAQRGGSFRDSFALAKARRFIRDSENHDAHVLGKSPSSDRMIRG